MQKIPTLFERAYPHKAKPFLLQRYDLGCLWVRDGQGVATRKYDGVCAMLDEGGWWFRRELKPRAIMPEGFRTVEHKVNGKYVGWIPSATSGFNRYLKEALLNMTDDFSERPGSFGTYELCGPKINGNTQEYQMYELIAHRAAQRAPEDAPRDFWGLKGFLEVLERELHWEGLVWHHSDGRMAKLKARDYR